MSVVRDLIKGNISLSQGIDLVVDDQRSFSSDRNYEVLFGAFISHQEMSKLDSVPTAKAILYLPWNEIDEKTWYSTWKPAIIGKSPSDFEDVDNLPAGVESELKRLTTRINLSTGLTHPLDKEAAIETIKDFKGLIPIPDPEQIRQWAIRNNWGHKAAEELKKISLRFLK